MAKKSTKLETLHGIFKENKISFDNIELSTKLIKEIKKNADAVPDYRHPSYTKHLLGDIIMIIFFAVLANANEWYEIETFAKKKEKWLRRYLELPYGIPTDDTIRIVTSNIDTGHFFNVSAILLLNTVDGILVAAGKNENNMGKTITAIDGKESCGSKRKHISGNNEDGAEALHTLNVYSCEYRMCIAQKFIDEKTKEIPAAQEILKTMDLHGTIITADAMNCQKDTVATIVKSKGDYVLALKGNQKFFYEEVKDYFDNKTLENLEKKENCYYQTIEKEHGGIVVRKYYITEDTSWFCEKNKWKKLNSFGMVHKIFIDSNGKKERKTDIIYVVLVKMQKSLQRLQEGTGEWKTTFTGNWILHIRMIKIQVWQKQVLKIYK